MPAHLYRIDHIRGENVSTLVGEYATEAEAIAARAEFRKTVTASWMISINPRRTIPNGEVLRIAAL